MQPRFDSPPPSPRADVAPVNLPDFETHAQTLLGGLVPPETNFRVRARGFGRWYVFDAAGEPIGIGRSG